MDTKALKANKSFEKFGKAGGRAGNLKPVYFSTQRLMAPYTSCITALTFVLIACKIFSSGVAFESEETTGFE